MRVYIHPTQDVITRIMRVFINSTRSSLTTQQICGTCRSLSDSEVENCLTYLRDEGVIACTSGQWWVRERKTSVHNERKVV